MNKNNDRINLIEHWQKLLKEHTETNSVESSVIHNIIIFPEKKTIYIKYPKCGGSTLYQHIIKDRVYNISLRYKKTEFIDWLNNITQEEIDEYYIFTISRNPYSRIKSAYRYLYRRKMPRYRKNVDFELFCKKELKENFNHHWVPMTVVCNNKNIFNYIGDLEKNFNASVLILLEKIDWRNEKCRKSIVPQQHNKSNDKLPANYTQETLEIINIMYKNDFELFNFEIKNNIDKL